MSRPEKNLIVTGANAAYGELAIDLVRSLAAADVLRQLFLAMLDLGLEEPQRRRLTALGVSVFIKPDWPHPELAGQPEWYKAIVCRPYLPQLLPGYDHIIWIDADSWLQDRRVLQHALDGARRTGFCATLVSHAAYWHPAASRTPAHTHAWHCDSLRRGFGEDVAQALAQHPTVGAALLCGRSDAPHWAAWQQLQTSALQREVFFSAEQSALNVLTYRSGLPVHLLDGRHYWNLHLGRPGFDPRVGQFVGAYDGEPFGLIGLTADQKDTPSLAETPDGRVIAVHTRFGLRGQRASVTAQLNDTTLDLAGMASPRFREHYLTRISERQPIRLLQIGAMDGVSFDPIHTLIKRHQWAGVLVEPNPGMLDRLRANYADCPDIQILPVAIAETPGTVRLRRLKTDPSTESAVPSWAKGLATLTPERTAISGRGISQEQFAQIEPHLETIEVEGISYAELLVRTDQRHFDVVVIDTEGFDYKILRQIPLADIQPQFVQFEAVNLPSDELLGALQLVRQAGLTPYLSEDRMDILAIRESAAFP